MYFESVILPTTLLSSLRWNLFDQKNLLRYLDIEPDVSKDELSEDKVGWGEREGYEESGSLTGEEGRPTCTFVHRRDGTTCPVHLIALQQIPLALFVLSGSVFLSKMKFKHQHKRTESVMRFPLHAELQCHLRSVNNTIACIGIMLPGTIIIRPRLEMFQR